VQLGLRGVAQAVYCQGIECQKNNNFYEHHREPVLAIDELSLALSSPVAMPLASWKA